MIALECLALPTAPPDLGVDASWCGVLQHAHQRGLQFGRDIVFTYGPLGYLVVPYCLAAPSIGLILTNAALCFGIALGLCLVAWRLPVVWRIVLLIFFVIESVNAELRADLLLQVGILCWGLLCLLESGSRQNACVAGFIGVAAFAALSKVTYIFVSGFSVCAIALCLGSRRQWKLACAMSFGFAFTFLIGWLGSAQSLSHVGSFIYNAWLVSREYDQAARLEGLWALHFWGAALGLGSLGAVVMRVCSGEISEQRGLWMKLIIFGWVGGLILVAWKHSMVRLDRLHFFDLAVFGPVAAFALEALPGGRSRTRTTARILSLAVGLLSLFVIESFFLPGWWPSTRQVVAQCASHTRWLLCPSASRKQMQPQLDERRREADLPDLRKLTGNATVDIFGFHQAHALLNNFNYTPRPVFQSYVAYTPELARLNEDFYLSRNAPSYVLFELAGLEHRFASLDDALALRALLSNYAPVGNEKGFLLLKRNSEFAPKLTQLEEGRLKLGAPLDLSRYSGNLWLELDMQPTWGGRLLKLFYRPPVLRLSVWVDEKGELKRIVRRQAAASVMAGGFLCSPFLRSTEDVQRFYDSQEELRPKAISVEAGNEAARVWKTGMGFKLYKIETRPGLQTAPAERSAR